MSNPTCSITDKTKGVKKLSFLCELISERFCACWYQFEVWVDTRKKEEQSYNHAYYILCTYSILRPLFTTLFKISWKKSLSLIHFYSHFEIRSPETFLFLSFLRTNERTKLNEIFVTLVTTVSLAGSTKDHIGSESDEYLQQLRFWYQSSRRHRYLLVFLLLHAQMKWEKGI